jgi:predicted nucleic acid-binding protein
MSGAKIFVDTNVLLYWMDMQDTPKATRAREWIDACWDSGAGRLSWQVLHEFYSNATRKMQVPAAEARRHVKLFGLWQADGINLEVVERCWYWTDKAQVSYWDGLILASAEKLGCSILLSEDFQAGRNYEGVRVVNPFQQSPREIGLSPP